MSLFDLFGELKIEDVIVDPKKESYSLKVVFSRDELSIVLNEKRGPELKDLKNGISMVGKQKVAQKQSLFEKDNLVFEHNP